ncbi:MAG: preprotein translocase subunit SecA, partial [Verrucomicrobiales bacterium]
MATERHESRRIDRQLRGRCARQGDPGESIFFISFEDNLMRNFGASERMTTMMERFGLEEGQELSHPWLNKSVETAQKRVEARNYQIRKHVLEYDNVMNQQRDVVYSFRNDVLESEDPHALILEIIEDALPKKTEEFFGVAMTDSEVPGAAIPGNDLGALLHWLNSTFPLGIKDESEFEGKPKEDVDELLTAKIREAYNMKIEHEDADASSMLE